jgi:hypothetical protein
MIARMTSGASSATLPGEASAADGTTAARGPLQLRLARTLLVLLALLLPFEAPLFRLGPLQITSVELMLYATLAAWGLVLASDLVRSRFALQPAVAALRRDPMVQAAVLWCVVLFACAIAAPSHRAAALKFTLRSLSGVLAFFAARALSRPPEVGRRVLLALVAGSLASAATAVVDLFAPSSGALWSLFREGSFGTLGLTRASGVFGYPTIGAMYWEASLPLLVVAPFLPRRDPGAMRSAGLVVLGSALLFGAILASATRSAIAGGAVVCVALLGLVWRMGTWLRRAAAGALVALVVSAVASSATSGSLLGQRLRWWHDESWFRAAYAVDATPRTVQVGEAFAVPVMLRNTGTLVWPRAGDHAIYLAYHWETLGPGTHADYEGMRTELSADVPPGGELEVIGIARAPAAEGTYRLRWDLVQEGVTWFSDQGSKMPEQQIEVIRTAEGAEVSEVDSVTHLAVDPPPPSRPALWRAAVVLWRQHPLLGIGPDNFRRRYQAVLSPAPTGQPYTDTRLHANSLYFETLADLGLVGVIALGWIALALLRLVRGHYVARRIAGLGSGVAAGSFFVHGGLDYFFEFTPLFGLFWLLLGLTAACELGTTSS